MNDELLAQLEREVLGWPGVWKKRDENGPGGIGVTGYRLGRSQIGHVHDNGHADFRFPREVRDELIRSGRAISHPAFPDSRTTASYRIRSAKDVPGAIELFCMSYERLEETTKQQAEHHLTRRAARLAPLRLLPYGYELRHRFAGSGYNDLLTLAHPVQQSRQVRLGLMNVHHPGH